MSKKTLEKDLFGLLHITNLRVNQKQYRAEAEAELFHNAGVKGLIAQGINNELGRTKLESILENIKGKKPLLIHVIGNDYKYSFRLAQTYGARAVLLDFIPQSKEGGWESYQTDPEYLKQAEELQAEGIGILIKADPRNEGALNAHYGESHGVVLRSDRALKLDDVMYFQEKTDTLILGQGTTQENLKTLLPHASGVIVGANCREKNYGYGKLDPKKVEAFVREAHTIRTSEE